MKKIDELLERAYKNNKIISFSEIFDLNLTKEEYGILIDRFAKNGIEVKEDSLDIDNNYYNENGYSSNSVKQYLNEISAFPLLSADEEKRLFYEYKITKDQKIREKLVNSNLRLVVRIAKEYSGELKNNVNDFLDLIQEGNRGLIIAVERFDVTLGHKFSTYAPWWIRQTIKKSLSEMNGTIRLPINLGATYRKIKKIQHESEKNSRQNVSDLDVALSLGIEEKRAKEIIRLGNVYTSSLDQVIKDMDNKTNTDFIPSEDKTLEEKMIEKFDTDLLMQIIDNKLTEKQYFILSRRLGFINEMNDEPKPQTLQKIGNELGVTKERVRQILVEAYATIKKEYARKNQECSYVRQKIK